VAAQTPHSRKPADKQASRTVKASVCLDVATNARLAAAAALEGIDKSTYMNRVITESLKGIVVFDRRRGADQVDSSSPKGSANGDEGV
jgi:hypothetical protein